MKTLLLAALFVAPLAASAEAAPQAKYVDECSQMITTVKLLQYSLFMMSSGTKYPSNAGFQDGATKLAETVDLLTAKVKLQCTN